MFCDDGVLEQVSVSWRTLSIIFVTDATFQKVDRFPSSGVRETDILL